MWSLPLLISLAHAADIYLLEGSDGSVSFTDVPPHGGYTLFLPDDPPPSVEQVNTDNFPHLDDFDAHFLFAEQRYGVKAELLKAICVAESGMNPKAVSQAGARGLMQLMPATAEALAVADPFDPAQAIDGGARYMARQLRDFGDVQRAVAAYNAGPAAVRKYNGIPPYEETEDYVPKVMAIYDLFRRERPLDRSTLQ
jgi:hypothetical protein